jgi:hypothetical protein
MFKFCSVRLCGLALSLSMVSAALGQYNSSNSYSAPSGATQSSFLNQMALRNAQALLANSLQQTASPTPVARIGLGVGTSTAGNKPFSYYSAPPTVSPYLNLFRTDVSGNTSVLNYTTLVRPQLQQEQINQQLQRQQQQENRQLERIAAQPQLNPQGSKEIYPTGHQTVFMYYDHYYSGTTSRKRQR